MSYNDYNRNNRRRPQNRRPSSSGISRRTRNRVIIVTAGLLIFALIIVFISSVFSCICAPKVSTTQLDTATKGTEAKETDKTKKKEISFREPEIDYDEDSEPGVVSGELYIWNKKAFEPFYGGETAAKTYAKMVNSAKKTLGSKIKVYTMVFPNHIEMGLPSEYKNVEDGMKTDSQADYIKHVYSNLDEEVGYINAYNELSKHCNEYIYFNSDHHWTGLGAFYAYKAFAKETKQTPVKLAQLEDNTIEGFTGSLSKLTEYELAEDAVTYWDFPYEVTDEVTTEEGETETYDTCFYKNSQPGDSTYGVFLYGDNPIEKITSESPKAKNKKIAIIHESYGNALVPYFTYNYKTIYSIDFRSWKGNLKSFCKENKIDEVLFANGTLSSATALQVKSMQGIIK
ncbi:MAG: DHHW family protein [Ruminococcus sp.]|nr:DHHW family protein [Ruminococcus sp.]